MRVVVSIVLGLFAAGCVGARHEPSSTQPGDGNSFEIGGGRIEVVMEGEPRVGREAVMRWVHAAAEAVVGYYGRYPVRAVRVEITVGGFGGIGGGREIGGSRVQVALGDRTTEEDLRNDWVLTHEMFHLAFPDLGDRYLWMNEGLSDYLEPVARARAKQLSEVEVWKQWVEGFPQGQPEWGDRGLDNTHTWGRTYWGGTIFWLLADIRIREQTHGSKSLDDALKAILAAGGDGSVDWEIARVFEIGDRATGTTVIRDLHEEMGNKPVKVDLRGLWRQLGVRYVRGAVSFDDTAPLALVRKALTAPIR